MEDQRNYTSSKSKSVIPGLSLSITASEDSNSPTNMMNLYGDNNKEIEISDNRLLNDDDEDDDQSFDGPAKPTRSTCMTRRRVLIYTSAVTIVAVLVMTIGIAVSSTNKKKASSPSSSLSAIDQAALDVCPEGIIDKHWPVLELKFDATPRTRDASGQNHHTTMTEDQIVSFVQAVQNGYNSVVEQCGSADPQEYKRWSFTTSFISQKLSGGLEMVDPEGNGFTYSMQHNFVDTTNLVVQVMMGLSCDGCDPEEAFASSYPTAFVPGYDSNGDNDEGGVFSSTEGGGGRRRLIFLRRRVTTTNTTSGSDTVEEDMTDDFSTFVDDDDAAASIELLSAADLLTSISNAVQMAVPELGQVAQATVTISEQIDVEQMSGAEQMSGGEPVLSSSLVKQAVRIHLERTKQSVTMLFTCFRLRHPHPTIFLLYLSLFRFHQISERRLAVL
jgi:hypothetical protein